MKRWPASLVLIPLLALFLAALFFARAASAGHMSTGFKAGPFMPPSEIACSPWQQVNSGGFGLAPVVDPADSQAFAGEDSFETLVFKDRLYVGMEADNELGARLWRSTPRDTAPQTNRDWEEVIADAAGRPWGIDNLAQVDHVDSLAAFNDEIYVSSANSGEPVGIRIFKSATGDPGSWQDALPGQGPGFGNPANENFKDMIVFQDRLCGGTWNTSGGAEIWCTRDGTQWDRKNEPGFGDPLNAVAWSAEVFNGRIYFGVQHLASADGLSRLDSARIYRSDSLDGQPDWELVLDAGARTNAALLLGEANGRLYAATSGPGGIRILESATGDAGSWQPVSRSGMSGSRANTSTNTDGAVMYQGRLHVAVSNPLAGFRVWRLDPDGFWRIAGQPDAYSRSNTAAQLAVFEGALYAWSTNAKDGQAVLATSCSRTTADPAIPRRLAIATALVLVIVLGSARVSHFRKSGSGIMGRIVSV